MSVSRERRFVASHPCPVCGGHERMPRGSSARCFGFLSEDGLWAHCTREEYAGNLDRSADSDTYAHKLTGDCRCGKRHDSNPDGNGHDLWRGRIENTYDYHDADGKLLWQVVRFYPKGFAQRRPDGLGGWNWSLNGVKLVLYRLPELLASDPDETVYVVEGEKDADRLASLGLTATTNPHGAKKWRKEYTDALKGRRVAIISDNDEEGREHAESVAAALNGAARSIRVLDLPNLPQKGDVSDWLNAGGTVEELSVLVENTPEWESASPSFHELERNASELASLSPSPHGVGTQGHDQKGSVGRLLSGVVPERVEWLWKDRIPLGKLTLVDGDPGTGKSAVTTDPVARTSAGFPLPDGTPCEAGGVVLLNAEDGLTDTIRPRLEAAGADLEQVLALATIAEEGGHERLLSIPDDIDLIRRGIEQVQAKLVVIDPLMAFLSGDVNSHRDQDVRRALAPLAKLAEETGTAVVVVRHLNKGSGDNPLYRGGGSIGIVGAARSALLVAKHPEDEGRRVLASLKSNLAKPAPSLAFVLAEATNGAVKVEWKGATPLDAAALLAAPADDEERRQLASLRDAVVELLEGNGGSWEGEPTELFDTLAARDFSVLPDRADELTKLLQKIARMNTILRVSRGRRRDGDKVVRTLTLELSEMTRILNP